MRYFFTKILYGSLFIFMTLFIACSDSRISVEPATQIIEQYKTLYVNIHLNQFYNNPYNPDEITVDAIINTPAGQTITIPCFYLDHPLGNGHWQARFTPVEIGSYSYHIQAVNSAVTSKSDIFTLNVEPSEKNGFLHMNNDSYYSLRFDSGKRFRGVGLNVCWDMETEWKFPYETYFDELYKNNANFMRIWMCTWNVPLEWTKFNNYKTFTDELENWDKTFYHSPGLKLVSGKTTYTEDDLNRVTFPANSTEAIIYKLNNIKRFKIKTFYKNELSRDRIKCYVSFDNKTYTPIDFEYSQSWDTQEDWHRVFIAYITDLPDSINYLKIEFMDHIEGTPHLANVVIEYGEPQDILDAPGLGRYYEKSAKRFDELLKLAEERNIYIMLAIDYHGIFKSYIDSWASNAEWRTNPYNKANGGPCETPADFFTNPEAKQYYKNRLRYMVARWGHSPNLAVWEFWNEINNAMDWQNIPADTIADWHDEMSTYLKSIDPYDHIVSTSVANRMVPELWKVKNLDFSQHHPYGPTKDIYKSIVEYEDAFSKPHVIGEYAISWKPPGQDVPVELYEGEMHNGLWRGMFSPTPILPLTWWWEWHLHKNEYFHFKMAEAFVSLMLKDNYNMIEEVPVKSANNKLEIMGLKNGNEIFIWILNKDKTIFNNLNLIFTGIVDGKYQLKKYNTWKGEFSEDIEIELSHEEISIKAIKLKPAKDMALWLRPVK
ncbi:MAG: DUF5060 domain-containing protein [Calditrichaceae bacterium]